LIFYGALPVLAGAAAGLCAGQLAAAAVLLFASAKKLMGLFDGFLKRTWSLWLGSALSAAAMTVLYRLFDRDPFQSGFAGNLTVCFAVFLPGAAIYAAIIGIASKFMNKAVK
jgi:hypothetical protein